ncbi:DUF4114 domain-containing protein, partial [Phormidium sp. CCY1219]|uniref:DUF4114 domain-containing protein n=1 Tax=Phormidium sp. CCY1219 TaxID=2886104 RepID=UPI002D1EC732
MFNLFFGWTKLTAAVGFKPREKTAKRYRGRAMRLEEMRTPSAIVPVEDTETADDAGFEEVESELLTDESGSEEELSGEEFDTTENADSTAESGEESIIPEEELEELPFIDGEGEESDIETSDSDGESEAVADVPENGESGDEEVEDTAAIDPESESENSAGDETEIVSNNDTEASENPQAELTEPSSDADSESETQSDETGTPEATSSDEPETVGTEGDETAADDSDIAENSSKASESEDSEALPEATTENTSDNSENEGTEDSEETTDNDTAASNETDTEDSELVADAELSNPQPKFDVGTFKVGQTGTVQMDYLYDGGGYGKGEVAFVSMAGMEELDPKSVEFIREAATRAASNSELGHTVISDSTDAARFTGNLGERDWNFGEYQGVKTVSMRPGDEFFIMLVPNGKVQDVLDNPSAEGAIRPLFSFATANPDDAYHVGQISDVTGEGNTFAIEDLRVDTGTDKDYNDIVLQIRGAKGTAPLMDDVVAEGKDWRTTELGRELIDYVTQEGDNGEGDREDPIDDEIIGEDDPIDEEDPIDDEI